MSELGLTGKILASDITDTSPAFQRADIGLSVPTVGRIEYVPALLQAVRDHDIKLIVPLTDLDLRSLARQRDKFTEAGCEVMVGDEQSVTLCRDKARSNAMLEEAGLVPIKTYTLSEFRSNPFFPCFVKPIRGSASVGTSLIHNGKELRAHISTFGNLLIVQEYVSGQEFTIDVYRDRAGQIRCVVPRQRLVIRSGEVEKGITVKDDELIESTIRLGSLVGGLWGVYCCQCRREPGKAPRFFEINPRFGGGSPLSVAAGANLPLYVLQEVLGREITAKLGEFTDRLLMMRYDEELFMPVEDPTRLPGYDHPISR